MTDGPRRLNRSGGVSQRLLDSASLDKPSHASRRSAVNLASTASAFSSTRGSGASASVKPLNPVRTLATWITIGAAASVALGFVASTLLDPAPAATPQAAATLTPAPSPAPPAAAPSDISAEPTAPANAASFEEARKIEAARAAVSRGDAATAIAQLDDYDSSHPNGQLKPESMALRIQVLTSSGKTTEARALANEFERKYPQHPLVQQVTGGVAK
jgi:TolA-binding protein